MVVATAVAVVLLIADVVVTVDEVTLLASLFLFKCLFR